MKWLSNWFIDNPVGANLLMVMILAGGLLSLETLRVESFPQIPPTQLTITVMYPGGTAKQVDESITQRVEDAISSIAGIKHITSSSSRGVSQVHVKKKTGTDLTRLLDDVKNRVENIQGFPKSAEKPLVTRDEFTNLAAYVIVFGDASDDVLQKSTQRTVQALKRHPEISQVSNLGQRQPQLIIEPDPEKLRQYGLSLSQFSQSIQQWTLEYRSGELKTAQGSLVLRSDFSADTLLKLRKLPVINTKDGSILLEQIAELRRGYEEDDSIVRYQGKAATAILVSTSRKDNLLDVSQSVQTVLQEVKATLPVNIELDTLADMAPYIKDQLHRLGSNAWQGLMIVLVLLGLFLNLRLAFWVALGIPISLAGALWLMGPFNYSINDITLFGMILVLGILVDDAVVVGESIHDARSKISNVKDAARKGVDDVAVATVFGVLTTIAAFSPMLWIENDLARILAGFSAVVILALIFSLIESKFILPSHLASIHSNKVYFPKTMTVIEMMQGRCSRGLEYVSEKIYLPILQFSLFNRAAVFMIFTSFMILAYGLLSHGIIKVSFFPEIPGRYVQVSVTMDLDAPLPLAIRAADQLETSLKSVNKQLQQEYGLENPPVERTFISVESESSLQVVSELSSAALARIPGNEFLKRWQEKNGLVEGSYSTKFSASDEPAGGTAITITARDYELAREVAKKVKKKLEVQEGVNNVYDDSQGGQRQLRLTLNQRGRQLGLTQSQLATLIGSAYGDLEVQRLLYDGEETKLIIRFSEELRRTQAQLNSTLIHIDGNHFVTLEEVATIEFSREPSTIYRRNREEVITIYWRQNKKVQSSEAVLENLEHDFLPMLRKQYIGTTIKAAGEFEEISDVKSGFKKSMMLTILLIFILLAIPLKSYFQPLIIMTIIPFGYAGALYGHGLLGLPVSILSLFGMMAMTGIVINDSLVLMTRFNQNYHDYGMPMKKALIEAGRSRMRAIFLTTITTVCGLLPLLAETSEQGQYLKPAAVSLVFGELFATPITLILIPILLSFGKYKRRI
jgi:multidrug efflux pump subunit AcrB